MMFSHVVIAVTICLASVVELGNGYRILGIFATPCFSHQRFFQGLTLALNKRGHELIVVTSDPMNDSTLTNYTEIDISFGYDRIAAMNFFGGMGTTGFEFFEHLQHFWLHMSDEILSLPDMRKLYAPDSNEKFDLLMVEMLYEPVFLSLAQRFDVPVIGITSLGLTTNIEYSIGDYIMPSYDGKWEIEPRGSEPITFWQRLKNFIYVWEHIYSYNTIYMSKQQAIARKYFGNDVPHLSDLQKNVSLIFVSKQAPISYLKPIIPKIIPVGGFHVSKKIPSLPKELQNIFDEATEGFVYMSLGSTGKSTTLPNKTINQFVAGFAKLPYKVLWKFEDDVLPGKPDNVHIMKWVPQQAVLAHPNLKVFVYQGGLQSTEEAIANAVPLVGIPGFCDQLMQVNKLVSLGVALQLELTTLDDEKFSKAITTVASDSSYKENMLNLRSLINDKPQDLLEDAIWWTEFVIRHRGAPHLHSTTADQPWYSRQDMDVVAFISATSVIVLGITLVISYKLVKSIYVCSVGSLDVQKKIN